MIPAYWHRAALDHASAARDCDTVWHTVATDVVLRDRVFPETAPRDVLRSLAAFMATPHGGQLPVLTVQRGDVLVYWTTHRPSADEYVRQHPGTTLVDRGRKADALVLCDMVRT